MSELPARPGSSPAEEPSAKARIHIVLKPTQFEGTAEGQVPAGDAQTLLAIFGMIAMGAVGIASATITFYLTTAATLPWGAGLALIELGLALTVILLIARRDRHGRRRRRPPAGPGPAEPGPAEPGSAEPGAIPLRPGRVPAGPAS
jgi:hypothetical protein